MKLKAMNFNIQCGNGPEGHSMAEKAERLGIIIKRYDPDVIGLQEYTDEWIPHIDGITKGVYEMFNKYRAEDNHESPPVFWKAEKFECLDRGYFWLSDTPDVESKGWDEMFDVCRICIYVILKSREDGTVFNFMNTHYGFGTKGQVKSSRLIYDRKKMISDYPTLVTGDFNMEPDTPAYAEMTKNFTDINAVTTKDFGYTYHDYKGEAYTGGSDGDHIDYCFVDEKIKPLGQRIIRDSFDGKYPGDHYGVFSEMEI